MSKYVVYMKNDNCVTNKEFFKDCGVQVEGHHDPEKATAFKTKKEANEFKKQLYFDKLKTMLLSEAIKEYGKSPSLYRSFPKLDKSINVPYDSSMSLEDIIDFYRKYSQAGSFKTSYEVFASYPKLYSITKYLWDVESYTSKDYKKKYTTFCVKTERVGEYKEFLKEFNLVVDKCDFTKDGYKIFPIIDYELNEYESRKLFYKDENDCKIVGSYSEIASGTLKEMFNLMKSSFYYE